MAGLMRIMMLTFLLIGLAVQVSFAYDIPQRRIDFKPYLNFMFPNKLMESDDLNTAVEDEMGMGFGVKARTQIAGNWGFTVNASITDLKVSNNTLSTAHIFTVGFNYSYETNQGDFIFDLGYGVLSVADLSTTLLLPGLEFNRPISERVSISAGLSLPVANDWFHNLNVKENYKSLSLSLGGVILF